MRPYLCLTGLLLLSGCPDAGPPSETAPDAAPKVLKACLERDSDLPRPPTGELSCELIPPPFRAPQ